MVLGINQNMLCVWLRYKTNNKAKFFSSIFSIFVILKFPGKKYVLLNAQSTLLSFNLFSEM